ncbi:FAD-dependent oxidoreductase [Inmirania thermothiophila]|uniref:Putative adenylylsulfate reductase-associated electron transfer protein QmoA n=1 Tax=Inmirania thermothiophila TaxID=1750597 RepID=A0A3N1Y6U2_9GAMM|nr:FAD-dependent oxidoreductase [Inmirania thermothiophila]ROR34549.1 putative adenylylsulfate reductase-associated electron transfer protein QmoA [Inmirania thermothiophila]
MSEAIATSQTILVVGGGISGMTAALEAAEVGKPVILVEKSPSLGGRVSQLHRYFPKLCVPSCGIEINLRRLKANPRVRVLTLTEVVGIEGGPGDYRVRLRTRPRYVTEDCTACGACAEVVEAEFEDEFQLGLGRRKGAYLPHPMAFPQRYVIDPRILGSEDAERAKAACRYGAIDLDMRESEATVNVGAIIWATGWRPYDADRIQPYGHDRYADVVTNMEFERMADPMGPTGGRIQRPSTGEPPRRIAFIQCAGSRDVNHLKHCSRICCMATLKQTHYVREALGEDVEMDIYYIDIRAIDRLDDFHRAVRRDPKIRFIKSKVANITRGDDGRVVLHGVDTEGYRRYAEPYDLVVLATGMEPAVKASELPVAVAGNEHGFIERDPANGAIFAAGCAEDALDVNRAAQSATAAALRAIQVVNRAAGTEG